MYMEHQSQTLKSKKVSLYRLCDLHLNMSCNYENPFCYTSFIKFVIFLCSVQLQSLHDLSFTFLSLGQFFAVPRVNYQCSTQNKKTSKVFRNYMWKPGLHLGPQQLGHHWRMQCMLQILPPPLYMTMIQQKWKSRSYTSKHMWCYLMWSSPPTWVDIYSLLHAIM